ncbi:hypothetical protein BT96DRAFT_958466 [Gymnopus androsaceus JB14]|uniref:CxC2-like cysteine cluster KDZ transposase-associated domain-containing protein n=1 Tax=Gymnopus androsaceus JB14 TaxID=1447944 RepID=A0A6A4HCB2_9AGAR|nr:hypothetical protein BT96DRAFT_958466 [Gymnopus androsaceus JB14]
MHQSLSCPHPRRCHNQFRVLHTNGIHEVDLSFCGCERGANMPDHIQLLRKDIILATFRYLELLHHLMLATKASTYDFYRGLCKVTNASGLSKDPWRYCALVRMVLQWQHLKLLKRCGRGHDPSGVAGTADGELVVQCPSCPHPGINLPKGWENDKKNADLYALRVAMDANFRLKEQLVSSHSRDPGLNNGKGYFVPREPYEKYVLLLASEEDISTCAGFQGLRYMGVGAVGCARGEMWLPNGAGSLQKGERMENQWPPELRPPSNVEFIPVIGKFHEPAHKTKNHEQYSANLIQFMGMSDWELLERLWGIHNVLGNATKTMGPGTRINVLEAHFGFHNWEKYIGHGATLWQKYKAGLRDRNRQREAHESLTNSLPEELVKKWEDLFDKWEHAPHAKDNIANPWTTSEEYLLEAKVEKELALEDAQRLRESKRDPLHQTHAAKFIKYSLDIEDNHIPEEAKVWLPSSLTAQERERACTDGLCDMEICLRKARCYDALQGLRHTLHNANIREQRDSSRSREIIDGIHERAKGWANRYHRNHSALLALLGPGDWESELRPLLNGNVRSYSDVKKKKGPGRWGTNEEQVDHEDISMDVIAEEEEEEINLLGEERDWREGTGQSRELISWIWRTMPVSVCDRANHDNELLRVEWGRSRAHMARGLEEVRYAQEDMRRTVEFMEWRAEWWVKRETGRIVGDEALQEGLSTYTLKQAAIQRGLKDHCIGIWKKPLDSKEHAEDAVDTQLRMMLGVSSVLDEGDDEDEDEGEMYDEDEGEDLGWA